MIRAGAAAVLPFDPGLFLFFLSMLGLLCFVGFVVSIVIDYFRSKRPTWL
jgi:hypothetical protein